jgi:hypothetical protein
MPQHVRGDHPGQSGRCTLGALTASSRAATPGHAVWPANCATTTTEPEQVMALNYITPVPDLTDGTGTPLAAGPPPLNPPAQLTDATGDMIVTKAQLSTKLAGPYPQV